MVEVTFFAPDSGAAVVGIDRPVGVGNGAVEVALGEPGSTSTVVGIGKFGIKPDRLVEVGDGAVEVALGVPDVATVVVGSRRMWDRA